MAREYGRAVAPPLLAIMVMTLAVLAWQWVGRSMFEFGDGVWLVLDIVIGAAALVLGLVMVRAPQLADIMGIAGRSRSPETESRRSLEARRNSLGGRNLRTER